MPNLYILTGPSGVGKTTVAKELLGSRANLKKVVTCTTRPAREGEVDGTDYHFLSEEVFKGHIERGEMFEWAQVYDKYYGSRTADVDTLLESGNDVLMVIDVQGAKTIKEERPDVIVIFLTAESEQTLLERLERRDAGTTVNMEERQAALAEEMAFAASADHTIMNKEGGLEETVAEIAALMDRS